MRMSRFFMFVFLMVSFTSCKEGYELTFKPLANSSYKVEMVTVTDSRQQIDAQEVKQETRTEMKMRYEVKIPDDSLVNMDVVLVSMRANQKYNGQEVVTNSEVADSLNPAWLLIRSLMGARFNLKLNRNGIVKSIQGMDELTQKLVAQITGGKPEFKAQAEAYISQLMSKEILRNMVEQSTHIFPSEKVGVDDSWNTKMDIIQPIPLHFSSRISLNKVEEGKAMLDLVADIAQSKGAINMMGVNVTSTLGGKQFGKFTLGLETGIISHSEIRQEITGDIDMEGKTIPMTIVSTTTTHILPL